ncbi:alpha/beta hydrolase fold domain-containing protein [Microbacterium foliorum]|uniref:alpha/beta hydrolase fold domain-containing protein n=2 Tax=Microbacterium foliorum TaxID=104336 RepID=UPI0013B37BD4|nr:alpha/beta hydrolase fold domain-containing protein [Microbacterium foliorum]
MIDLGDDLPPLDEPVLAWLRRTAELTAALPDAGPAGSPARRRAAREVSDIVAVEFTDPAPDGVRVDDLMVAGAEGPLRARRFRSSAAAGPQPTMLWLHGGGWTEGTIDEILNERVCADRALRSGVQLISLEYRLAPEHPFPAPVLDAVAALADLRAHADEWGIDTHRLGVGGNSAGATIAASAALRERDAGRPLHHQTLEVPPTALRPVGESMDRYRRASGMEDAEGIVEIYRAGAPLEEASPLDAADHRHLAPALILAAEHDPLRDGAIAYTRTLQAAGVPVVLRIGAGHVHGSPGLTAHWHGARAWRDVFAHELACAYATTMAGPDGARPLPHRSITVPVPAPTPTPTPTPTLTPTPSWRR